MGDFFQIFVISQSTEILIESNFWLGMYVVKVIEQQKEYKLKYINLTFYIVSSKQFEFYIFCQNFIKFRLPYKCKRCNIQINFFRKYGAYDFHS